MNDPTETTIELCEDCQKRLTTGEDFGFGYCPHNQTLAVAEIDPAAVLRGEIVILGYRLFGRLTLEQAQLVIIQGLADGKASYDSQTATKH